MSTSSGLASKGEKQKVKFQSLDINSLYRVSRGEHLEKTQQKSTLVKHGMQSLGKVPSARRAPKNLPSMKSEHHGSDTATPLVPQGGPGWGKQDTTTTSSVPATTSTTTTSPSQPTTVPLTPHQAAIALPVTTAIPPNKLPAAPGGGAPSSGAPPQDNKSWSAVTSGGQDHQHPPPYQSAQFQHEFPSLSVTGGEGGCVRVPGAGGDPGLSLRPQTEGSWIQGGQGARGAPGQQLPPQLSVPAGQSQDSRFPQQYRGVIPSFMYKGNFPPNSTGGSPNMNMPTMNGRNRSDSRPLPRTAEEEVVHRPIIKEEDLSRMDEISKDVGWATHDDIDYNQKLTFSDDESSLPDKAPRREPKPIGNQAKEHDKTENHISEGQKNWSGARNAPSRNRSADEEELWVQQKRHQHSKEIDVAVQRAKQRREEEEKRFSESMKKGAAKKLAELDEKKLKRERDVNAKSANIPLPDFQKDKDGKDKETQRDKEIGKERDRDSRPKTPNDRDSNDDKTPQMSFRHLTQIEAKNVVRSNKHSKVDSRERDGPGGGGGGGGGSNFSKFDMPPRFLKQQRNNNMHPPMHYQQHQFDNRWSVQSAQGMSKPAPMNPPRKINENPDDHHEEHVRDYKRQSSDEIYRIGYRQDNQKAPAADGKDDRDYRYEYEHPRRDKEDEKWQREKEQNEKHEYEPVVKQDDWHGERRDKYREEKGHDKYERPQRPDSRDSRTSRESRHSRDSARDSEPREYLWADHTYDTGYEEKRRDFIREDRDRRVVPGPITKERIEADDMKNEKRKLTQLKRGQIIDKKISDAKRESKIQEKPEYDDDNKNNGGFKSWGDASSSNVDSEKKDPEKQKDSKSSDGELKKSDGEMIRDRDDKSGGSSSRNRNYLTGGGASKGWGSSSEYHRSGWSKRSSNRGGRSVGSGRGSSNLGESHGTDSEGSLDDHGHEIAKNQRSPKPPKKLDDEKNRDKSGLAEKKSQDGKRDRDSYVPRGEPSKHGRGGGNSFRNRGSIGKRIDGYGPPPSKSPFGNHDEKKVSSDETSSDMAPVEDKTKQSQQALSAGIIGSARKESSYSSGDKDRKLGGGGGGDRSERNRTRKPNDGKRGKSRSKNDNKKEEEIGGSTSDNSDENNPKDGKGLKKTLISNKGSSVGSNSSSSVSQPRHSNPPRLSSDKRSYRQTRNEENIPRQNSATSLRSQMQPKKEKSEENVLASAIADISLKNKEELEASEEGEEKSIHGDSDGFQEVKSKKNFKEKPKSDEKSGSAVGKPKLDKDKVKERPKPMSNVQLTQQQISSIPPLMSAPVNPPQVLPQQNKREQFDRPRNKLAPRFAKQRENNRLQKAQMQQHGLCDVSEMNKVNQSLNVYGMKESGVVQPIANAWEKPLGSQLRGNIENDGMLGVGIEKGLERNSPSQTGSPGTDKDKTLLDGTTPPVNTIIFENTNFKSAPVSCNARPDKPRSKLDEAGMDNSVMSGFNKPMVDLMNKQADKQSESMQLPLSFKEDNMKLDFFDSDLSSHLADDKIGKNICLTRSMHGITGANSTISTAESLNFKIASVKKVWENTPPDHGVGQEETAFGATFDTSGGLDPSTFSKAGDVVEDNHEGYGGASPGQVASNSTTNVCKVKPTQQVSGNSSQAVLNSAVSQQMVAPGLMGNPLSPPPMQPVIGAGVGLGQPPQQFTTNQHLGFQASLTGSTQYNMPAIPSPPTVLYNSTQQLQQAQTAGLYGAFQIDQSGVLGGRTSSQYSQYPNHYGLGQTASAQYGTAQSMYLQAAQPPAGQGPPPPPPPDIYAGVGSYRLSAAAGPFGQSQGVGNNTTVLISSTANSLMSASVKPSSQQMSAIGTKSGGVGQAYQQQSQQQQQQVYMTYDPTLSANYLPSAGVIQRGPAGPVQNNVVPALQASSSYYSGSTGGQTGYFQQPGSSTLQSAQLQQPQGGYGLQGNVFGTHNQSHTNAGLQSFNSHFLSTPILAAALSAQQLSAQQQFRSNLQTQYMKGVGGQSMGDQSSRAQQLKSPGSQEMLSSVFNSGSQIPSPKSRQNCKQPLPQPSPTGKHNYNLYQGVGNQQAGNAQRYPTPIQRPVNFQQNMVPSQNSSSNKHRSNQNNKAPPRQYYSNQGNSLTSQAEKHDDPKVVVDSVSSTISANISSSGVAVEKAASSASTVAENSTADSVKDKEAALND